MNTSFQQERYALVVCDMQPDLIGSLSAESRETLLTALVPALEAARSAGWSVVFSGLRFPSGYVGVPPQHKLYGAMARLNQKMGDKAAHWFMEGYDGAEIAPQLRSQNNVEEQQDKPLESCSGDECTVWRTRHIPYELAKLLEERRISKVFVTGSKASGAVQAACQLLMDKGIKVSVVKECVQDDNNQRLEAIFDHLLPVYSDVVSLKELMDDAAGGTNQFLEQASEASKQALIDLAGGITGTTACNGTSDNNAHSAKIEKDRTHQPSNVRYCTDCGRHGHGKRFIQLFLERPGWKMYPTQPWYEDFIKGEFFCPLAKKVVNFCDEPEFSKLSMYLSGREWLDEKDKVIQLAGKYMPETFCLLEDGTWLDGQEPPDDTDAGATGAPWFVKEADKNLGGDAIGICHKPSEIRKFVKPDQRYVVQQHVRDPLLMDDGRKVHLKFYVLLTCEEDGVTWTIYTYRGALLSISPNPWSPEDLSQDTQVTIHRHPIPPGETEGWKQHWPVTHDKCQQATAEVVSKAISGGHLKGRPGKKQFEVFSADWMPDEHGNLWMFEFNMSPAVCQSEFDDPSNRDARRDALMEHDERMLREALGIVLPWDGSTGTGQWDLVADITMNASANT
jgi:nicotinamidase-related amidase